MNLLILSCSTGGGHNSAASAVRQAAERAGHTAQVVNALSFLPPRLARFVTRGHDFAYRHTPHLYGAAYRFEETHPPVFVYEQNIRGAGGLGDYLRAHPCDGVVCVHVFAAMMMTELRRTGESALPFSFVATDYTCSPGVDELTPDVFCIPHAALTETFILRGVPADKLAVTGIPVLREMYERTPAKTALRKLGLGEWEHMALLACGSMGSGPIPLLSVSLLRALEGTAGALAVVCGSSRARYRQMHLLSRGTPAMSVVGYTRRMGLYYDGADVLITKAGGLTTAEAVAKQLPLIYIDAVPGCESRNIEFMTGRGCALCAATPTQAGTLLRACIDGEIDLGAQLRRRSDFPNDAARAVVACMRTVCAGAL